MVRVKSLSAFAVVAMITAVAAPAAAQDACQPVSQTTDVPALAGGDAALNATQPGPAPSGTVIQCWTGAAGNAVIGGRAVAMGEVVSTLGADNIVVAFDTSGTEVWRTPIGEPGRGLPGGLTAAADLFVAASPTGLYGLSPSDGSTAWHLPLDQARVSAETGWADPVGVGAVIYAVLNEAVDNNIERWLVSIDATSGAELWRTSINATLPAGPPSADDATVAVWDGDGSIRVYDAAGDARWTVDIDSLGIAPAGPMSMSDELLVAILATGELVGLSLEDGAQVWQFAPEAPFTAAASLVADTLYVNAETVLYAVDATSGELIWQADVQPQPSPFEYRPIPALSDGLVIIGTTEVDTNAAMVAFDAASGAEQWRTPVSIFGAILSPVVSGGRIYAPAFDINQEGGLLAFGDA